MKKFLLSAFIVVSFIIYSIDVQLSSAGTKQASNAGSFTVAAPTLLPQSTGNPTPTGSSLSLLGQYKDGNYLGSVADAFYGNIQVKAVISGGKITDIQFLDYPHDRGRSVAINTYAMPGLKSEAITAQSASVDIVSGATATSQAFVQSLQSALDQAKM